MIKEYPMSKLIVERRTIKKFKQDRVEIDLIKELLQVASWAPNHKLREPWRFLIYTGEGSKALGEIIEKVSLNGMKMKRSPEEMNKYFSSIPTSIFVIMPLEENEVAREEDYAAVSALIQNFQLAAWERGLGVFWKGDGYLASEDLRKELNVKENEKIVALLHVGYPDLVPNSKERTAINEKIQVIDSYK